MKGVPIKFRAKDSFLGKTVYGDLIHYPDNHIGICPVGKDESAEVDPDSVAQLVGYDADGNEVYEDDKLILGSHEYIAGIRPVSYTDDKKYYKPEKDFSDFLLKEV